MNWRRGMQRTAVAGLGLAAFLALLTDGDPFSAFHDHDVLWTVYQDGSKYGWVVGSDTEELACIKGDRWKIGDPIVVDRNVCPTVVSMRWGVNPAIQHRGPVGLVLSALLLLVIPGVPVFLAGYWAVRGFLADEAGAR